MTRPQHSEVSVVESAEFWFVQPLHDCKDRGIYEAHICIGVAFAEFADSPVVLGMQLFDLIGTGKDIIEKGKEDPGVKSGVDEPVQFDQHRRRDHQGLSGVLE